MNSRTNISTTFLCFILFFIHKSLMAESLSALSIEPKRILLNKGSQSDVITLTNKSDASTSYRVYLVERVHNSSGQLKPSNKIPEGHPSSAPFIRFSPKQIRLEPGAVQIIRVSRNRSTPSSGEYRSHLLIQSLPNPEKNTIKNLIDNNTPIMSGVITQQLAVSIPVLLRQSPLKLSQVSINSISLEKRRGELGISVDFERSGESSVFGELNALIKDTKGSKWKTIATARGVAIHVPRRQNSFFLPLFSNLDIQTKKPKVRITFTDLESRYSTILADQEFQL